MKGLLTGLLSLLVLLSACGPQQDVAEVASVIEEAAVHKEGSGESASQLEWLETGDLGAISQRGELRILTHLGEQHHLPRSDYPLGMSRKWLVRFAKQQGLQSRIVTVDSYADLIPALLEGRGDVISSNFSELPERRNTVSFTRPLDNTREYLVAAAGSQLRPDSTLSGLTLAVQRGTSFAQSAARLASQYDGLLIDYLDGSLGNEAILDALAAGRFDLTIADGNFLEIAGHYRDDFISLFPVSVERDVGWAVRPGAVSLLSELNRFISAEKLASSGELRSRKDFDAILERKVLRVAMPNTMATYFLWRGELFGFEYELARRFAEEHDLHLQVRVADSYDGMLNMLRHGKADIAAAFITPTPWRESINIAFSRPYHYASEILVSRPQQAADSLQQLNNRAIVIRRSSSYWQTVQNLVSRGHILNVQAAEESLDTEHLIDQVGTGIIDLTVSDSHILALELTWRNDVVGSLSLTEPRGQSWAVREDNPRLLLAINEFLAREYQGAFYQQAYHRYFKTPHPAATPSVHVSPGGKENTISPYDELFHKFAEQYAFDWRLLAAQAYQESRFDASATNWSGAKGLLQVSPQSARSMGFYNIDEVETGLHAGVKYLAWLREEVAPGPDIENRTWFALAAYNVGIGHLRDARALAKRLGKNPDQWFDNVEEAMVLLSRPKYASKARYGYVRGMEPLQYVRNIRRHLETFSVQHPATYQAAMSAH